MRRFNESYSNVNKRNEIKLNWIMKSTSRNEQKEEVKLKHFRQWASRLKCICILITGFIQTFGIVAVCTPVLFSQINMFIIWLYKTNQPNDFYRLQNEGNLDARFSKFVHIWTHNIRDSKHSINFEMRISISVTCCVFVNDFGHYRAQTLRISSFALWQWCS